MKKWTLLITFIKVRWFQQWSSRAKIEKYQKKMLEKQFAFMKNNSPFYYEKDFSQLALMNKEEMMEQFDCLNTVGMKKEIAFEIALNSERTRDFKKSYQEISIGLSSGTSGNRGIFLTSKKEQAIWAGTILAKMLPKKQLLGHKIAFLLRADNELYQTVQSRAIEFEYFDLYQSLHEHVARLNQYQPTILIGPVSILNLLAKELKAQRLHIQPQKIISVAEILEERDAEYLKESFSISVIHQIYQCTEGFLGYTCALGSLHLNEDIVKFEKEYIDDTRFYPIITDFKRTSQPILNYRLNDILVEAQTPCNCGSKLTVIKKIEGREDDIFYFEGTSKTEVAVFPDFIRRCLLFVSEVREYRVIQLSTKQVIISADGLSPIVQKKIVDEFNKLAMDLSFIVPTLVFRAYNEEQGKKMKRIQCMVKE